MAENLSPVDYLRATRAASCWWLIGRLARWTVPSGMLTLRVPSEGGHMVPMVDHFWRRDKTWLKESEDNDSTPST